jgi:hypothetical protein
LLLTQEISSTIQKILQCHPKQQIDAISKRSSRTFHNNTEWILSIYVSCISIESSYSMTINLSIKPCWCSAGRESVEKKKGNRARHTLIHLHFPFIHNWPSFGWLSFDVKSILSAAFLDPLHAKKYLSLIIRCETFLSRGAIEVGSVSWKLNIPLT